VSTFYDRNKLKSERGVSVVAIAFERALKEMHSKICQNIGGIAALVKGIPSAENYKSPFSNLSEEEFANKVFSELA